MADYLDNMHGTVPHAMGFYDNNNCPECDMATEIMIERCPQRSIALALTSQSADFGKDGKIIISEKYFDKLRKYSADGKITPGNSRKVRRKEGIRQIYYDADKHDMIEDHYDGDKCKNVSSADRVSEFSTQFAGYMDDYFIQSHLCGTSAKNVGCNDCGSLFQNIGTADEPSCIEIPSSTEFGTSPMQVAGDAFIQYLIQIKAYGDNMPDNCSSQMYVILNSCFAPLMSYMKHASKASCDNTCALDQALAPLTTDTGMLPHVYFSKRVPLSDVNGVKSSPVLAGYYGDDILRPEPVKVINNKPGKHTAMWDYAFYSFQYANVRPDRKWQGYLSIKEGGA